MHRARPGLFFISGSSFLVVGTTNQEAGIDNLLDALQIFLMTSGVATLRSLDGM
jgi:hypothetical protein